MRKIDQRIPEIWSDKQTDGQTNRDYNFIYKDTRNSSDIYIEYVYKKKYSGTPGFDSRFHILTPCSWKNRETDPIPESRTPDSAESGAEWEGCNPTNSHLYPHRGISENIVLGGETVKPALFIRLISFPVLRLICIY